MPEETWETLGKKIDPKDLAVSVMYYPKHMRVEIRHSNVADELSQLLRKLLAGKEFLEDPSAALAMSAVEVTLYYITQLASSKTRLRFVMGKEKVLHSEETLVVARSKKESDWSDFTAKMDHYSKWNIDTTSICERLGCGRVAFLDSEGAPSKKPAFEIAEQDGKIIITGTIKPLSHKEFNEAFPIKKKKKTGTQ